MRGPFRFLQTRKISFLLVVGYLLLVSLYIPHNRAFAGTATSTVNVSATVIKNCIISTTAQLAFGNYDPVVANATVPLSVNGALSVTCTKNAAYKVYLSQGSNPGTGSTDTAPVRRMTDGTNFMSYGVYTDAADSTSWGGPTTTGTNYDSGTSTSAKTAVAFTMYGQIPAGQDLAPAPFTDTVTATVSF